MFADIVGAVRVVAFSIGVAVIGVTCPRRAAAQTAPPEPAPPPLTVKDWLTRPEMTGDWGGARERLLQRGTKLEPAFTQFFDWAPEEDDDRGYLYGGKLDVKVTSDLGNVLWKGFSAKGQLELRYGEVPSPPVNGCDE
jgi:hypothetical protein